MKKFIFLLLLSSFLHFCVAKQSYAAFEINWLACVSSVCTWQSCMSNDPSCPAEPFPRPNECSPENSVCGPTSQPTFTPVPTSTPTPTITPSPTLTPSLTPTQTPAPTSCPNACTPGVCGSFSIGSCNYDCGDASIACGPTQYCNTSTNSCQNFACNDSCPGNGFDCGGGLYCSGLAGNRCRNISCGGATDCACFGTCGNGVCDVGETYQSCATDGCACTPDCAGKICGEDGCGGSCGSCGVGQSCAANGGSCVAPSPTPAYTFTANPNPCTLSSGTCSSDLSWSTNGYSNVTVVCDGSQVASGASGTHSLSGVTASCVNCLLRSNSSTISSVNVCGSSAGAWIKLKDASFQSTSSLNNTIPASPQAFDSDDNTSPYFIISSSGVTGAGIAVAPTIAVGSTVSQNDWKAQGYTPHLLFDKTTMLSYVKSRKEHTTITSLSDINKSGIYVIDDDITLSALPSATYNVILIVSGTVDITADLITTAPSFGIIADTITIHDSVTEVDGLLVADTINTTNSGSSDTKLKIKGNLITENLENGRTQNASGNNSPSVFVVVDSALYANLLPFISTAKYEWRQLQ